MIWTLAIRLGLLFALLAMIRRGWCQRLITDSCEKQGLKLERCKLCWFNKGPYTHMGSKGRQSVFWIEAIDDSGKKVRGYARILGLVSGLWRRETDIKWN